MLEDAASVFADPDGCPNHLCDHVARISTIEWATNEVEEMYADRYVPTAVKEWSTLWPLPIGFNHFPVPMSLLPSPFPRAHAFAVFKLDVPFVRISAFAVVDTHPAFAVDIDGVLIPRPVTMQFALAGWQPDDGVRKMMANASRWWDGRNQFGRPAGSGVSFFDVGRAYASLRRETGRNPSQLQVASRLSITDRRLRDIVQMKWNKYKEGPGQEAYEMLLYQNASRSSRSRLQSWPRISNQPEENSE